MDNVIIGAACLVIGYLLRGELQYWVDRKSFRINKKAEIIAASGQAAPYVSQAFQDSESVNASVVQTGDNPGGIWETKPWKTHPEWAGVTVMRKLGEVEIFDDRDPENPTRFTVPDAEWEGLWNPWSSSSTPEGYLRSG